MTQKQPNQRVIEPTLSVQEVCQLWHVSPDLVRKKFRGREGIMQLGGRGKRMWRIPVSLVFEVMCEMGYTPEQAERALKQAV